MEFTEAESVLTAPAQIIAGFRPRERHAFSTLDGDGEREYEDGDPIFLSNNTDNECDSYQAMRWCRMGAPGRWPAYARPTIPFASTPCTGSSTPSVTATGTGNMT